MFVERSSALASPRESTTSPDDRTVQRTPLTRAVVNAAALDEPETYERLDPGRMWDFIGTLPAQCQAAWDVGQRWPIPPSLGRPGRVVILGVGGSAIGAELVAALAARLSSVPVQVVRGYEPPALDARALVMAVSHSGETEETLGAFNSTLATAGMRLAITAGGTLYRDAAPLGYAVLPYEFDGVPRAAIGWGVFALLALLSRLDVLSLEQATVEAVLAELAMAAAAWNPTRVSVDNAAKQLAVRLQGRIPLIVGPEYLGVVARRWAGQINENAKQWAFHSELPEADHNLIAGLGAPIPTPESIHVVFLASDVLHERNRLRIQLTAEALDRVGITHDELLIGGAEPLDVIMRATHFGDWVSLYLAMLNEVDHTPVEPLDQLQRAMRQQAWSTPKPGTRLGAVLAI